MLLRRPGRGRRLLERRVQAAVVADPVRQRVEVGLGELGQLAEALDLGDDRVLVADRLQHLGVGAEAGLAAALAAQLELLEEHRAELLRRADHELLARQVPDLALELDHVGPDPGRDRLQLLRVELDAGLLGLAQDVHERQLDVVHQVRQAALLDLRALGLRERVDQDGVGRELVAGVGGDPALLGELVERVAAAGRVEQVAGDGGVEDEVRRDVAERLGVVGDHRAVAGGLDHGRRVVGLPRERDVAARVGGVAPHRLARDQLALGDLRRRERDHQLVALHARDVARDAREAGLDLDRRDVLGARDRLELGGLERLLEPASGSRSSQSRKTVRRFVRSGVRVNSASRSMSIGTSRTIVASCFDIRALSACSVRFCLRLAPVIWSMLESTPSRSPNFCSRSAAVLSPMPGTPGMLSLVSPLRPMKSGTSRAGCRSARSRPRGRRPSCPSRLATWT